MHPDVPRLANIANISSVNGANLRDMPRVGVSFLDGGPRVVWNRADVTVGMAEIGVVSDVTTSITVPVMPLPKRYHLRMMKACRPTAYCFIDGVAAIGRGKKADLSRRSSVSRNHDD